MVSHENINASNIIHTWQVYLGVYMYTHMNTWVEQLLKKEAKNLKEFEKGIHDGLEGGKGREEWYNYVLKDFKRKRIHILTLLFTI